MATTHQNPLSYLHEQLAELEAKGQHFRLRVLDGEQKPFAQFDGKEVINLSSNNYLGLTTHKTLRRAAIEAIRTHGVGAGAVRTIAGTMDLHMALEQQIAKFKGTEACVVFQSGFTANAGTVAAILGKDDLILSDELNHASIIDGCRLSRATIKVFKHKDVADCERLCKETENWPGHKLLITDGVFSMDGDIAPLPELCSLAEKFNCIMMVDDAHSSGVLGRSGRGTVDHLGCHGRVHIQVGTLSKAIGAMGGYVCGSRDLIDFLIIARGRFFISTGHPPSVMATCQAAFTLLDSPDGDKLIEKLWANTKFFQRRLKKLGLLHRRDANAHHSHSCGRRAPRHLNFRAVCRSGRVHSCRRIPRRSPEGKARLRAIVTATHKRADLERACEIIAHVGHNLGLV